MKRKYPIRITTFIITAAMLCACGGENKPVGTSADAVQSAEPASSQVTEAASASETQETTAETSKAVTTTEEPDLDTLTDAEKRQLIIDKAMTQTGNTSRLLKAFEKAERGEEVTVAYIGGSITEGYTVQPEECWAKLTYDYLCEKYPGTKINYVNAGLSGTPSMLGLIRCERDVLAPCGDPDIVFIEFAVNDAQDMLSLEGYECLVRRMYELPGEPAVILMFMRTDNGYSCQSTQSMIGFNRGLPMISLNDGLTWAIDNGIMTWADYSDDGAHPNPEGCKLIAEMVENLYESALSGKSYGDEMWKTAEGLNIYEDGFINMHLLDSKSITPVSMGEYSEGTQVSSFPDGWYRKGGDNEGIKFEMTFDDLFIVYHCNKIKRFATADVYIDGEKVCSVDSHADDGWSNPVPQLLFRGDGTARPHTVEIKMQEGFEKDYFGILAFGITD